MFAVVTDCLHVEYEWRGGDRRQGRAVAERRGPPAAGVEREAATQLGKNRVRAACFALSPR